MVKQGPVPAFLHGLYEYIGGIALIAAPLLLTYPGAATAASIILGVLVIFLAASTASSTSLINQIPLPVHILLDYALAAILIASPFLFSFSGKSTPTAIFVAAGVLHLLVSIGTRYRKEETPARGERKGRRGRAQEAGGGAQETGDRRREPVEPAPSGETAPRPPRTEPAEPAGGGSIPEYRPPGRER